MQVPGLKINLGKAKNDEKTGEIDIYGVIGGDWYGDGVTPLQFKKDLANLGELDRLNVHIHSYGGSVYEGWAIFNALDSHGAEVHIYVDGVAMSMASVILMAGDYKHIAKNGTVMIHNPLTIAIGEAKDFRKTADELDKIRDQIVTAYIDGGVKKSREEIMTMMDEETYLTADEAVEYGFADSIGEEIEIDATAASSAAALIVAHFSTLTGTPANIMEKVDMTTPVTAPANPEITAESVANAAAQATANAHARFKDILALSRPGIEKFVQDLAADPTISVADAKMKAADEYVRVSTSNFQASKDSRNAPVTEEHSPAAASNTLQEKWEKNEGNVQAQFLDFAGFEAFNKANEQGLVRILSK